MNVEAADSDLPPGGEEFDGEPWSPWTPAEVARRLAGVSAPWAFAAGWAIDLFCGAVRRDHEDTEIVIPAAAFDLVRAALSPFEFDAVGAGRKWPVTDFVNRTTATRGSVDGIASFACRTAR